MKYLFFNKIGEEVYTYSFGMLVPHIRDKEEVFYYEAEMDKLLQAGDTVYFPDDRSHKIERIDYNIEGGFKCVLAYYTEIIVNEDSRKRALEIIEKNKPGEIIPYSPPTKKKWWKLF